MVVELDKGDIISLVMGVTPYYSVFEHPRVKSNGSYTGGFVDKWGWDKTSLQTLSENELYELYIICKNSWKFH